MPLRNALYIASTFSSLAVALVGTLFLVVVFCRRFRNAGEVGAARRQHVTDISAILLAVSVVCFLAHFLLYRNHGADPAPLLLPTAMLLVLVSLAFALFGRGVGRLAILLANVSIVLWLTTIILVGVYIDDLAPIAQP
jgi:hypothetical protein